jgi:hypothetical protein
MVQLVTKVHYEVGRIIIDLPQPFNPTMKKFVTMLHDGMAIVQFKKWYLSRSTGWKSQNHHINGHIAQIAEATGNDFDTVKMYCKTEAIGHGYPTDTIRDIVIPWSESRIDTLQASFLIDTIHQLAAELGISLIEEEF